MSIDTMIRQMETIWGFSSLFPRESYPGNTVWKRYNPSIIWPVETIRNNYLVHTKYSHSHEKMMLAYCQQLLNRIQNGNKCDGFLMVKGLNFDFFQMDWCFENSALLGRPSMPSILGTISNISKLIKLVTASDSLRQEIDTVYCRIVYPALTASGASIWSNLEEKAKNYLKIVEVEGLNFSNVDVIIESLKYLRHRLMRAYP